MMMRVKHTHTGGETGRETRGRCRREETMPTTYSGFLGQVQHRIQADTQAEAARTTRAVLATLGERLSEGGATDVAAPLPMEIDRHLLAVEHGGTFGYDEFLERVGARMNYEDLDVGETYGRPAPVDRSDVVYRTKAVVALVSDLVPGGHLAHTEQQLPEAFDDLFEFVDVETAPWESEHR